MLLFFFRRHSENKNSISMSMCRLPHFFHAHPVMGILFFKNKLVQVLVHGFKNKQVQVNFQNELVEVSLSNLT